MADPASGVAPYNPANAPVAQLDRVLVSEAKGHWFDSSRARHLHPPANVSPSLCLVFPFQFDAA